MSVADSRPELTLELVDVTVRLLGRTALTGVDLTARSGVPAGVTGPSGAGKTVLCLAAAGAVQPSSGQVNFGDMPLNDYLLSWEAPPSAMSGETALGVRPSAALPVGLVLQSHGILGGLTAEENVALVLQARTFPREETATRALEALASVGLAEHAGRNVDELSGGERQRVGIARALAGDAPLLVADEPTAELDPDNRARVLGLLVERARHCVVVVASDDPEVLGVCDPVVQLSSGRVVQVTGSRT